MIYGLVAMIVRMDDVGFWFTRHKNMVSQKLGMMTIQSMPYMMKALSFICTVAMFFVGGGIIVHGVPVVHHFFQDLMVKSQSFDWITENIANGVVGLIVSATLVAVIHVIMAAKNKMFKPKTA